MKIDKKRKQDFLELEFLFHQFNVNYTNENDDDIICSYDFNNEEKLATLFSLYVKERFLSIPEKERDKLISLLRHYLENQDETFEELFLMADPIFLSEIDDYRMYMNVLLNSMTQF